jgi:hypothetical protein
VVTDFEGTYQVHGRATLLLLGAQTSYRAGCPYS